MMAVLNALEGARLLITTEKDVQRQIGQCFKAAGLVFSREVPVEGGIIDFYVGLSRTAIVPGQGRLPMPLPISGPRFKAVGVEVKIGGAKRAIYRQLCRYAEDEAICSLVLVTAAAMGLPPTINGKPVTVFSLGRAWL